MLTGEEKFCSGCGQPLTASIEEKTPNKTEINQPTNPAPKKSNISKWIYIAIALVIAIFAYTSFTKSTPEKVAEEFVESVFSFDFQTAIDLIAHSADEDMAEEIQWMLEELRYDPESAQEELKEMKKEGYILKDVVIRDKSGTKDFTTLYVDMVMENGEKESGYIELVKESGKWKVIYVD
jgi:uncharacterized membrane protein YvbJ